MIWRNVFTRSRVSSGIIWLTDKELTLAKLKFTKYTFEEVLDKDRLQFCLTLLNRDYGFLIADNK